ncbi:MAG: tetratricopeptide repeat protein [Anaerolineae bacterium]|nr:tetratricopeptide repeat protein [Anaerolineae bacterium]
MVLSALARIIAGRYNLYYLPGYRTPRGMLVDRYRPAWTKRAALERRLARLDARQMIRMSRGAFALGALAFVLALGLPGPLRIVAAVLSPALVAVGGMLALTQPGVEARQLLVTARDHILREQFPDALQAASRALELAPHLSSGYIVRGAAYAGLGQLDLAIHDAEQAVRVAPHDPEARRARARLYSYRGLHSDEAQPRTSLHGSPEWVAAQFEMAQLYARLRDYERSLSALQALTADELPAETRYNALVAAGWLYEDKLKDLDNALHSYTRAIPLQPDRKLGYLRRAFVYRSRGDHFQAAEDFLRAAERAPTAEDEGKYHWLRAVCFGRRYLITQDERDMRAWLAALQRSMQEDAPEYSRQSREWLGVLEGRWQLQFPPQITYFPN